MLRHSKIEIKLNEGYTQVFIDGHRIDSVRGYELKHFPDYDFPILTLHLEAVDMKYDMDCLTKVDNNVAPVNVRLDFIDSSKTK
jgi:hypothetical protein